MNIVVIGNNKIEMMLFVGAIKGYVPIADTFIFDNNEKALQFFTENKADVIVMEALKERGGDDRIELIRQIQKKQRYTNILLLTDTTDYYPVAFELRISDYILKPLTPEKLTHAIFGLRYPIDIHLPEKGLYVQCFGPFEVFWNGKPFTKLKNKTKELFAYLVDKVGAMSSSADICFDLWEDQSDVNLRLARKDLIETFRSIGMEEVIIKSWGKLGVSRDGFFCDYYEYIKKNPVFINLYGGRYMDQYLWADYTNVRLSKEANIKKD